MSTKRLKKFIYNDSKTICDIRWKSSSNLDGINLFKVNFGNTRTMREIGSKVSLQTTEDVIDHVRVFWLLTLNRFLSLFWCFHCYLWKSKCWVKIMPHIHTKAINRFQYILHIFFISLLWTLKIFVAIM